MKCGEWWGWGADDVQIDEVWSRMGIFVDSFCIGWRYSHLVEMMMGAVGACFSETG